VHFLLPPTSDWVAATLPGGACLWCRTPHCSALWHVPQSSRAPEVLYNKNGPARNFACAAGQKGLK